MTMRSDIDISAKRIAAAATVLTFTGFLLGLFFSRNYNKGINVTIIFLIIFIISAIFVSLLWFSIWNSLSTVIMRLALIISILCNTAMLGVTLLFIDTFTDTVVIPVIAVIFLFTSSVLFLRNSIKL